MKVEAVIKDFNYIINNSEDLYVIYHNPPVLCFESDLNIYIRPVKNMTISSIKYYINNENASFVRIIFQLRAQ